MNSTSFASRLVKIAARSPGRSSTGPDVWRRLTPISRAMMWARVVLPRPGGPNSKVWSSASLRWRAAVIKISSWSRIFSCPTYSSSCLGRKARSIASSLCEIGAASMMRCSVKISVWMLMLALAFRQRFQRQFDAVRDTGAGWHVFHGCQRFLLRVTERQQGVQDIRVRIGRSMRTQRAQIRTDLALQFQQQTLSRLLADAGHSHQAARILQGNRLRQVGDRHAGQDRQGHARAHARDLDQLAEHGPFGGIAKAEQQMRIFADGLVREQDHFFTHVGQIVKRAHRHIDFIADTLAIDQQLWRIFFKQSTGETAYHRVFLNNYE